MALFPDHADSKRAVIEAADHAMYVAKKKTRNSVFIAEIGAKAGMPTDELASTTPSKNTDKPKPEAAAPLATSKAPVKLVSSKARKEGS